MIDYESLKKAVTPRELLERLSVDVTATGFALCPWHDDAKPSMKIYTDHVYCFSCNRYGDIIDLTRALTGSETHSEAARFIISEFNLIAVQSYGNIRSIYYKNISYLSKYIFYLIEMSLFLLSKQYEDRSLLNSYNLFKGVC